MLLHTPPPSAIVGKWLWNSVHYLWDSECVLRCDIWTCRCLAADGHWVTVVKFTAAFVSFRTCVKSRGTWAGRCLLSRSIWISLYYFFFENCMHNSGIWLPTLLYLVLCSCSSSPLLRRSFGATRGFRPTWIWVHVRRCGDNLGSGMLDWHLHCLFESFVASQTISFSMKWLFYWVTMPHITQWLVETFAKVVVAWIIIPLPWELYLSVLSRTPCWWALFRHRFVNKLTLALSSWRTYFHKKLLQVFLASWFSCKLEEMGKGKLGDWDEPDLQKLTSTNLSWFPSGPW